MQRRASRPRRPGGIPAGGAVIAVPTWVADHLNSVWARLQQGVVSAQAAVEVDTPVKAVESIGTTRVVLHDGKPALPWPDDPNVIGAIRPRTLVGGPSSPAPVGLPPPKQPPRPGTGSDSGSGSPTPPAGGGSTGPDPSPAATPMDPGSPGKTVPDGLLSVSGARNSRLPRPAGGPGAWPAA